MSIGWSCRIREVGRLSRNRVVLVFDPKDGWFVVAWRLIPSISGLGNGCEKIVVACRLVVSASGVESGCIVVELALRFPKVGRMSVRGRRKGALPCATRL